MKNLIKYLRLITLLSIMACNSDDTDSNNISAQDLVTNFEENPRTNSKVGTIQAVGGQSSLSFSISSQTPSGALSINAITGELSVANTKAFDFETNPVISATISIKDDQNTTNATATINLNDRDDIESFLTTTQASYIDGYNGGWIQITEREYNDLASNLNKVSRVGTIEAQYTSVITTTESIGVSSFTVSNVTPATIPSNSYVFALKYFAYNITEASTLFTKLSTTSISDGYSDFGDELPSHEGTKENLYFVLKDSKSMTSDVGYLAFYKSSNASIGIKNITNSHVYFAPGNTNTGLTEGDGIILYQGLSTTQKQW